MVCERGQLADILIVGKTIFYSASITGYVLCKIYAQTGPLSVADNNPRFFYNTFRKGGLAGLSSNAFAGIFINLRKGKRTKPIPKSLL